MRGRIELTKARAKRLLAAAAKGAEALERVVEEIAEEARGRVAERPAWKVRSPGKCRKVRLVTRPGQQCFGIDSEGQVRCIAREGRGVYRCGGRFGGWREWEEECAAAMRAEDRVRGRRAGREAAMRYLKGG